MRFMPILVNNCWTLSMVWAGALINRLPWNGQMLWESSKKFTEAKHSLSQQRQLAHWYRWVSRTLTQCRKPVLQGAHPPEDNSRVFWVPHCIPNISYYTTKITICRKLLKSLKQVCKTSLLGYKNLKESQRNHEKMWNRRPVKSMVWLPMTLGYKCKFHWKQQGKD